MQCKAVHSWSIHSEHDHSISHHAIEQGNIKNISFFAVDETGSSPRPLLDDAGKASAFQTQRRIAKREVRKEAIL
jgi:hypothetical protein